MDLVNSVVRHKVFGKGKICALKDNVLYVRFGLDIKRFIYPTAFKYYLTLTDKEARKQVEQLLRDMDMTNILRKEADYIEDEKKRIIGNYHIHTNSQAAFNILENEKQSILTNWSVSTGTYLSGHNRGKPRSCAWIYPNSACLLTCRRSRDTELNRHIWGVYMVREDFIGSYCEDGMIPAHENYRIVLSENESDSLLFWDFNNYQSNQILKWGSARVKYFSNRIMASILHKILVLRRDTEKECLAEDFLNYFCRLNKIDMTEVE